MVFPETRSHINELEIFFLDLNEIPGTFLLF